jgi:hypothetical protein
MHGGNIDTNSAAGRVFRLMLAGPGGFNCNEKYPSEMWWDAWDLTLAARITAIGTRISEIRHFLAAHPERGLAVERRELPGRKQQYRIVKTLTTRRDGAAVGKEGDAAFR